MSWHGAFQGTGRVRAQSGHGACQGSGLSQGIGRVRAQSGHRACQGSGRVRAQGSVRAWGVSGLRAQSGQSNLFFFVFLGGHRLVLNLIVVTHICQSQNDICFLLSKVTNQLQLISNLSHMLRRQHYKYKRIYNNHTLEPLNVINKYINIFLIGTGTDPCLRYRDGQVWKQSGPQSPKPHPVSCPE